MRRHVFATLGLSLLLGVGQLSGQTAVDTPMGWTRHTMQSAALGTERGYLVALPQSYGTTERRYPVLVLLDANDEPQFAAAVANIRFLASRNEIPELIVVGILNGADRTHDLTPPTRDSSEQKLFPTAGGGVAFGKHVTSEVLPAVHAGHRTLPAVFLAGHSFGGMFALYAATSLPESFRGAISMSPALQWSNTEYVVTYADALAKRTGAYRLFVTSGGLEPPIDVNTQRMIARLDTLKGNGGIAIGYRRYPDHTHGMTPLPSLVDGLRYIFEPISLREAEGKLAELPLNADSAAIVEVVRKGEQRYVDGARAMGLPDKVPEEFYNTQGYGALQWFQNPRAAVALFRRNVELYPESANVYDSLGDGLLAMGNRPGARAQFEKAVELARRTGQSVLAESLRKLEALKR